MVNCAFECVVRASMSCCHLAAWLGNCGCRKCRGMRDARALYRSVTAHLFTLDDDTLVYPGHDYHNRRVSTIGQEKARNPRLGNGRDVESFVALMAKLDLPYPKFIDYAVPGNRACGVCPSNLPEELAAHCAPMTASRQG
jgi:sulfur dioxygenase